MKRYSLVILIFLVSFSAQAQQAAKDTVQFKLTFAKSSDNDFTKGKPAELIGTFPGSDTVSNSWLANALIEVGIETYTSRWSFGLVGEIHKNTLIEKKQDVRQLGISVGKVFVLKKDNIGISSFEIPWVVSFKNSEDRIKEESELQIVSGASFQRFDKAIVLRTNTLFPAYGSGFTKALMFSHDHNIGAAFLEADDVLLGQIDFEFNAFLAPRLSELWIGKHDLFKVQFNYNGRAELLGDTERDLESLIDVQAGVNIPFGKKDVNSIGVVYDWIWGADPLKGLADQDYETVTVKAKIIIK